MRVLHFSDIHVSAPWRGAAPSKWLGKRAIGAANLLAGRGRRFREAGLKLAALGRFAEEQSIALVLFTGDYTALGLDAEFVASRRAVTRLMGAPRGFVHVPGNHDVYLPDAVRDRLFERHFGDTLDSDLPEYRCDGLWPLARLVDDTVAVVAVNGARPNPLPWRSSGRVGPDQLAALARLLEDRRVRDRFVFVLVHYAPRRKDGSRDHVAHRLVDDDAFLRSCAGLRWGAILAGHVHHRYCVRIPGVRPPLFCAGSATIAGREGIWLYETTASRVRAFPGSWDGARWRIADDAAVEIDAPPAQG